MTRPAKCGMNYLPIPQSLFMEKKILTTHYNCCDYLSKVVLKIHDSKTCPWMGSIFVCHIGTIYRIQVIYEELTTM